MPRPPSASLSSSSQTLVASLRVSPGFGGSPEFGSCRLRVLGSSKYRTSAVVSAEGTEVGDSVENVGDEQVAESEIQERDFTGTPYVPIYVMLPLGVINMNSELVEPEVLMDQLRVLKSVGVDGVMVDCWWGIVEAHSPQGYNWSGYKKLFQIVRDLNLKLQVVMSFHECGGNVGDDVHIPLPQWVTEIGQKKS